MQPEERLQPLSPSGKYAMPQERNNDRDTLLQRIADLQILVAELLIVNENLRVQLAQENATQCYTVGSSDCPSH